VRAGRYLHVSTSHCAPSPGHYVPAVSHRVYLANKNNEGPKLNLQVSGRGRTRLHWPVEVVETV
jgi:hypothetical protein